MASTRYSESRTLVRRLRRLSGESHEDFKGKVLRLRRQFEQFNVDASELCQWLMALRPSGKKGSVATKEFWEFFLEPEGYLGDEDQQARDSYRRMAFDVAAGLEAVSSITDIGFRKSLVESVRAVGQVALTPTATSLFERLSVLDASHRQILLKAAAEWVVARYVRGYQNWESQREVWEKEKAEWEKGHPELRESIREDLNKIFRDIHINRKRPRVCTWDRLKENRDDCEWAGERIRLAGLRQRHSSPCVKYKEFLDSYARESGRTGSVKRHFVKNAKAYLELRGTTGGPRDVTMARFLKQQPQARWFPKAWEAYLKAMEINEQTVLAAGRELPHCVEFRADKECRYNRHTNECEAYRRVLEQRPDLQPFEGLYRQWRREYLRGPAKPCFQYPSPRKLPMPKVFGKDYCRVDLVNSLLELRLEGSREARFERFRFAAWPADYQPKARDAKITSVHVSFVGTRARVGFHFEVSHKKSRFGISQDDIDELRSRKYPRQAQDAQFLDEARKRLVESFAGDSELELRILAVDLGTSAGAVAVFEGRRFQKAELLKIVKIDMLYDAWPEQDKSAKAKPSEEERKRVRERGLGQNHVGRHLESWVEGVKEIAKNRAVGATEPGTVKLGDHDMRRLALHIRGMIRDWVRLNTSQIVESAERNNVDLIIFESMRGFSLPGYDKLDDEKKRRLAFFAHGRIRHKVREKAVERGMRVVTVPYLDSSKVCAICGKQQERKGSLPNKLGKRLFRCQACGHQSNSDENAACALARVFWGEISLPAKLSDCS